MSPDIARSAVSFGTNSRRARWAIRGPTPGLSGFRNSRPCAAQRYSIATILRAFSRISRAFRAAPWPMELWSSWPAEAGIESAEAGWAYTLFSDARAAAVYWRSIIPDWSPPCSVRNGGRPLPWGGTRRGGRGAQDAPGTVWPGPREARALARVWAWKVPPPALSPVAGGV